jgi:group I intron endonuclease
MGLIYKITNNINEKSYIGQTTRKLFERKGEHKYAYKKDVSMAIYHAFKKYGFDNFTFGVVEDNISKENYIL